MAVVEFRVVKLLEETGHPMVRWCEVQFDEFKCQKQVSVMLSPTGEWLMDARDWNTWEEELVEYFIKNSYKGPEIDEFIRQHALGGYRTEGRKT